ncbi:hypothetical protein F7725_014775 [Dissostichus mawsoni]|uniref:Uncharacterized protein n=1 Tax=Dissostichus mawsoni TaxID=36200 RepID=A0A7J5YZX3_DISMA|nr:hypothetical protein F7725_014775 [Dissostichus mawsoni]
MTQEEHQTLKELQHNTSIILKPSDKGSSVVIMDRYQNCKLIRFQQICSNTNYRNSATKILFTALKKWQYPRSMLRQVQKEVYGTATPHPHDQERGENGKIIPFVTTYSSHSKRISRQIKQNLERIMEGTSLRQLVKNHLGIQKKPQSGGSIGSGKTPPL